jgi:flagellar secretion chaperone FliS
VVPNSKSANAYQTTHVTTASPEKILLMLYEGAIKFTMIAKQRMVEKKIAEKGKYISKALAIIGELMNTLDHDKGGQLAADLENLYVFMMDKMIEGNIKNDVAAIECVENLLKTLFAACQALLCKLHSFKAIKMRSRKKHRNQNQT